MGTWEFGPEDRRELYRKAEAYEAAARSGGALHLAGFARELRALADQGVEPGPTSPALEIRIEGGMGREPATLRKSAGVLVMMDPSTGRGSAR